MVAARANRGEQRSCGLWIEGIGSDTALDGLVFGADGLRGSGYYHGDGADYEWVGGLLSAPDSLDEGIDPYTGRIRASSCSLSLSARDEVALPLLHQQSRTSIYVRNVALTTAATTVRIGGPAALIGALSDTVVWIDDEAILLGTHSADGTYNGCTRAMWGTVAQTHPVNVLVYTANPYILGRRASILLYNADTGNVSERRFFIDSVGTNEEGTRIEVGLSDLTTLLVNAQINRAATTYRAEGVITQEPNRDPTLKAWIEDFDDQTAYDYEPVWISAADTIHRAVETNSGRWITYQSGEIAYPGADPVEMEDEDLSSEPWAGDARQLFVITRDYDSASSRGLGIHYLHPYALALSFMRAGYDNTAVDGYDAWQGQWGCGFPSDFFDEAGISQLINRTPLAIDQYVGGWDGESETVSALVIDVMLRPYGAVLVPRADGRLTVRRFRPLTIDDWVDAQIINPVPMRLARHVPRSGTYMAVTALVGELPWQDGDTVQVQSRDGRRGDSQRRALLDETSEMRLDYRTRYRGTDPNDLAPELLEYAQLGIDQIPEIDIVVPPSAVTGNDYGLMTWIRVAAPELRTPWMISSDGLRSGLDEDNPSYAALIINRTENLINGSVQLRVMMPAYHVGKFARLRGPAGVIVAVSNDSVTIEASAFSGYDPSTFYVGDSVSFYYGDGEWTTISTVITGITGGAIEIGTDPGVLGIVPGMVVRMSDISNNATCGPYGPDNYRSYAYVTAGGVGPEDVYG